MSYTNPHLTLCDFASPIPYDPFNVSIDHTLHSPPSQTTNPKFFDMDDPDPSERLLTESLNYTASLMPRGPFIQTPAYKSSAAV